MESMAQSQSNTGGQIGMQQQQLSVSTQPRKSSTRNPSGLTKQGNDDQSAQVLMAHDSIYEAEGDDQSSFHHTTQLGD